MKKLNKFKLVIEFKTTEEECTEEELLEGSWLYDSDFQGAITKSTLRRLNK